MFMMKAIGFPYFSITLSRVVPKASRVTSGGVTCWLTFVGRVVLSIDVPPERAPEGDAGVAGVAGLGGAGAVGASGAERNTPGSIPKPLSITMVPAGTKTVPPAGRIVT